MSKNNAPRIESWLVPNFTWTRRVNEYRKVRSDKSRYVHKEQARHIDTQLSAEYVVEINVPEIINEIVRRAAYTKSGKSSTLRGLVTAKRRGSLTEHGTVVTEVPMHDGYSLEPDEQKPLTAVEQEADGREAARQVARG